MFATGLRLVEKWSPQCALGCMPCAAQEPEDHKRQSYPCTTKTSHETEKSSQKFLEPTWKPKFIYTDNSQEFGKICEDLSRNHCTLTPHRAETNGTAESAVRCYFHLQNIQDLLFNKKIPIEKRFGVPFNGPVIPFGAMVEYPPTSAKDLSRLHQFGKKIKPIILVGYALCERESGKETFWSQTLRNWKRWTHLNSTPEGSMQRSINTNEK